MVIVDRDRYATGMKAQLAALHDARGRGMPRRGWKVGLNVPEVLTQLGLRHSGVGWLNGDREYRSGDVVRSAAGHALHAEPELCLRLGADVAPDATPDAAAASITGVAPAIEIVDYALPRTDLDTIVAHSMFHYGFVVGGWHAPDRAADLGGQWPVIAVDGAAALKPRSDLVPAQLGEIVVFVAAFLAAFGESLRADDLILSGSYTPVAVPLAPRASVRAQFGPLGEVHCRIA